MRTELLLLTASLLAMACGEDAVCGAQTSVSTIEVSSGNEVVAFDDFTSSPNNDCPNPGSPTALTVAGTQVGGSGSIILCVSRPELIDSTSQDVGFTGAVQLVSVALSLDCPVVVDRSQTPTLEAQFSGFCDDGLDPGGFDLRFDGTVMGLVQCEGQPDAPVSLRISGTAPVIAE